ncbi:MAG: hypothetical protein IKY33_00915 [Clostridia bacterium]|nr:hypothetical protein [Clostridia bacterium]
MMKKIIALLLIALVLLGGCTYTKDGDADYVPRDEYVLPTSDTQEKGSVPYVIGKLVEMGQVVRDYNEMLAEAIGAIEAYSIRTNGITVEFYRFAEDNVLLQKTIELGAYPILNENGEVLVTRRAAVNGNIVMMMPADENKHAEDISALNDKLEERFKSIKLD